LFSAPQPRQHFILRIHTIKGRPSQTKAPMSFKITLANTIVEATAKGTKITLDAGAEVEIVPLPGGSFRLFLPDGVRTGYVVEHDRAQKTLTLSVGGFLFVALVQDRLDLMLAQFGLKDGGQAKAADLKAPMPGLVQRILVQPGQSVEKGTPLLVLVAMKMENMIKATAPGTVTKILVKEGDAVEKGHVLVGF